MTVERDADGFMNVDRCRGCKPVERDYAGFNRIASDDLSRQHAGIDLAPIPRHEVDFPAAERALREFGEHVHMCVPAAEQQQSLHAPGGVSTSSHARRRKSKPDAIVGLTIAK